MTDLQKNEDNGKSVNKKLNKLLQLKNEGFLTEEEYEYKKKRVIDDNNNEIEKLKNEYISDINNMSIVQNNNIAKEKVRLSKEKKIIAFIIIIIIITTTIIGYLNHQSQLNKKYIKAKEALDVPWYDDAISLFEELGDYKDSEAFYIQAKYGKAVKLIEEAEEIINNLKSETMLNLIDKEQEELTAQSKLISARMMLEVLNEYEKTEEQIKRIDEHLYEQKYQDALNLVFEHEFDDSIELLKQLGEYKDSKNQIEKITEIKNKPKQFAIQLVDEEKYEDARNFTSSLMDKDEEYEAIYIYSNSKILFNYGNDAEWQHKIDEIDPEYDGVFSKEIKEIAMQFYGTVEKWEDAYISNIIINSYISKSKPSIGMTAEEVRDSTWGSPIDINETTTQYGTNEQWVYSFDKYIYLDDGVVTAIQE